MSARGSSQKKGLGYLLPSPWSFGSSLILPSAVTDGVHPTPAVCPVQKTLLITAQKHECKDTPATRSLEDPCFLTENQYVGRQCFLQRLQPETF